MPSVTLAGSDVFGIVAAVDDGEIQCVCARAADCIEIGVVKNTGSGVSGAVPIKAVYCRDLIGIMVAVVDDKVKCVCAGAAVGVQIGEGVGAGDSVVGIMPLIAFAGGLAGDCTARRKDNQVHLADGVEKAVEGGVAIVATEGQRQSLPEIGVVGAKGCGVELIGSPLDGADAFGYAQWTSWMAYLVE